MKDIFPKVLYFTHIMKNNHDNKNIIKLDFFKSWKLTDKISLTV